MARYGFSRLNDMIWSLREGIRNLELNDDLMRSFEKQFDDIQDEVDNIESDIDDVNDTLGNLLKN